MKGLFWTCLFLFVTASFCEHGNLEKDTRRDSYQKKTGQALLYIDAIDGRSNDQFYGDGPGGSIRIHDFDYTHAANNLNDLLNQYTDLSTVLDSSDVHIGMPGLHDLDEPDDVKGINNIGARKRDNSGHPLQESKLSRSYGDFGHGIFKFKMKVEPSSPSLFRFATHISSHYSDQDVFDKRDNSAWLPVLDQVKTLGVFTFLEDIASQNTKMIYPRFDAELVVPLNDDNAGESLTIKFNSTFITSYKLIYPDAWKNPEGSIFEEYGLRYSTITFEYKGISENTQEASTCDYRVDLRCCTEGAAETSFCNLANSPLVDAYFGEKREEADSAMSDQESTSAFAVTPQLLANPKKHSEFMKLVGAIKSMKKSAP
eukprot:TRINITY_DN882_c0_g1_i1.p1 TRINITY_DN882_c0_g1~~TRINITY_DN882_c0_g1_i1.p1  ORF type:complete len:371 (-),score=45.82 TRINITY_DN882_c0_g1_i1:292-1404(-)